MVDSRVVYSSAHRCPQDCHADIVACGKADRVARSNNCTKTSHGPPFFDYEKGDVFLRSWNAVQRAHDRLLRYRRKIRDGTWRGVGGGGGRPSRCLAVSKPLHWKVSNSKLHSFLSAPSPPPPPPNRPQTHTHTLPPLLLPNADDTFPPLPEGIIGKGEMMEEDWTRR